MVIWNVRIEPKLNDIKNDIFSKKKKYQYAFKCAV